MSFSYSSPEQAIVKCLCFFDIFQYPLTNVQCWRLAYSEKGKPEKFSLAETEQALISLANKNIIKNNFGFWQLASSPDYYQIRQERYRLAAAKYRRISPWIKIFSLFPSVRLVAVVNSLGYRNPEKTDDIDFFIITRQKKVWLTRLYLTGLAKLLGLRPTIHHQQDGLCLSFYIGDDHLCLADLMLDNQDIYFNFWFMQMTVLFNDGAYQDLIKNNPCITDCFPNSDIQCASPSSLSVIRRLTRRILSIFIINPVEYLARRWQKMVLPQSLQELANKDTRVVISNSVLKFHGDDRRLYYRDLWHKRLIDLKLI